MTSYVCQSFFFFFVWYFSFSFSFSLWMITGERLNESPPFVLISGFLCVLRSQEHIGYKITDKNLNLVSPPIIFYHFGVGCLDTCFYNAYQCSIMFVFPSLSLTVEEKYFPYLFISMVARNASKASRSLCLVIIGLTLL